MTATVPLVPGVPALFEAISTAAAAVLLTEDLVSAFGSVAPQWGIFFAGAPVVVADNVVSLEYKQDFSVSDYPVEEGGFQSYNKVNGPFEVRVRLSSGGTETNRKALLDSIAEIADDLFEYEVRTPEATFASVNVMHYDYRRTARNGAGLIEVDVWFREVRETGSSVFGNTVQPSGADAVSGGIVQTTLPSAFQNGSAPI